MKLGLSALGFRIFLFKTSSQKHQKIEKDISPMSKHVERERHHFFANKGCLYSGRTAQNCLTMKHRAAKNETDVIGFDVVGR